MKTGPDHRHVLVVDDDEDMRRLLSCMLSSLGVTVALAANGAEALGRLREQKGFELVFTDFQMPVMDGLRLASRIKREFPGTRVVLMTGVPRENLKRRAAVGCVDRVLFKPFSALDISSALRCLTTNPEKRSAGHGLTGGMPEETEAFAMDEKQELRGMLNRGTGRGHIREIREA